MITNSEIPYGYCQCGCGKQTLIPARNSKDKNWEKGIPMPYCRGHYNKANGIPEWQKKMLSSDRKGENNPNWKGGKYFDKHNNRWMVLHGRNNKEPYAHIVAREKYKRNILSNEIVHHVDGDSTNDDPDNLIILTRSEHTSLHFKNKSSSVSKNQLIKNGTKGGLATKQKCGKEYYVKLGQLSGKARRAKKEGVNNA